MNILYFGASNSPTSINQKLAAHAANLLVKKLETLRTSCNINTLQLDTLDMPLYSPQRQSSMQSAPEAVGKFLDIIKSSDALIVSLAEHNGSYTAAFKNLVDWTSVYEGNFFQNKPMLLMATSPGARGGKSVLEAGMTRFPFHAAKVLGSFSLPEFHKNFSESQGITHPEKKTELNQVIEQFASKLHV